MGKSLLSRGKIHTECKLEDIAIFKSKIRIIYSNIFKIEVIEILGEKFNTMWAIGDTLIFNKKEGTLYVKKQDKDCNLQH